MRNITMTATALSALPDVKLATFSFAAKHNRCKPHPTSTLPYTRTPARVFLDQTPRRMTCLRAGPAAGLKAEPAAALATNRCPSPKKYSVKRDFREEQRGLRGRALPDRVGGKRCNKLGRPGALVTARAGHTLITLCGFSLHMSTITAILPPTLHTTLGDVSTTYSATALPLSRSLHLCRRPTTALSTPVRSLIPATPACRRAQHAVPSREPPCLLRLTEFACTGAGQSWVTAVMHVCSCWPIVHARGRKASKHMRRGSSSADNSALPILKVQIRKLHALDGCEHDRIGMHGWEVQPCQCRAGTCPPPSLTLTMSTPGQKSWRPATLLPSFACDGTVRR
eukprot:362721-Chlamydomonas_euryale.AAC.5